MIGRNIPDWLRRAPAPGVHSFAILGGIEATVRGILVSVWPLALYAALGDAATVSRAYFLAGLASLAFGLMLPWVNRRLPRRWLYTCGALLYVAGPLLGIAGGPVLGPVALVLTNWGTVAVFICTNAYVMDYIARERLGQNETLRLFYSALPWAVGPVLGVTLWKTWAPLPFLIAIAAAITMLAVFWAMRLGNGKVIVRAHGPTPNPLAYLGRFFGQPRLIAGWLFAVIRSSGWWVYVVYLPIFCIESGLGDRVASWAFGASNALLFLSPFMLRWMQQRTLRRAVVTAFACASACYLLAAASDIWPPLAVVALFAGSVFLVMLDTFGGLPFLMAVRPAERTEMSAVYSSFRDVSGIATPGIAWAVLLFAPVTGVFAACAAGLASAAAIGTQLHPRLGAAIVRNAARR
jgi:hypothetical protein